MNSPEDEPGVANTPKYCGQVAGLSAATWIARYPLLSFRLIGEVADNGIAFGVDGLSVRGSCTACVSGRLASFGRNRTGSGARTGGAQYPADGSGA